MTKALLPRRKKVGEPWLSRSLVSGEERQALRTRASIAGREAGVIWLLLPSYRQKSVVRLMGSPAPGPYHGKVRPQPLSPPAYWPTEGWRSAPPEEAGIDSAKLAGALLTILRATTEMGSSCRQPRSRTTDMIRVRVGRGRGPARRWRVMASRPASSGVRKRVTRSVMTLRLRSSFRDKRIPHPMDSGLGCQPAKFVPTLFHQNPIEV